MCVLTIREAGVSDIEQIGALCKEHALYEGSDWIHRDDYIKELTSLLTGDEKKIWCLVVTSGVRIVGYATCMKQYATWTASSYLYLDCLYLQPEARGTGLGAALMSEIAQIAEQEGLNQLQWQTPIWNKQAISFYKRTGAIEHHKSRFVWNP